MSDKELEEYRHKSVQKMVISSIADIEKTKNDLVAYKKSIENGDKRIEELKNELKKIKKKQEKVDEENRKIVSGDGSSINFAWMF